MANLTFTHWSWFSLPFYLPTDFHHNGGSTLISEKKRQTGSQRPHEKWRPPRNARHAKTNRPALMTANRDSCGVCEGCFPQTHCSQIGRPNRLRSRRCRISLRAFPETATFRGRFDMTDVTLLLLLSHWPWLSVCCSQVLSRKPW